MLGVVAEESEGVVGVGVAGVAVEPAAVPESAGAGVVGVLLAGAGSEAAGGVAAGVAGASSRLLQPASTAVNTGCNPPYNANTVPSMYLFAQVMTA